MNERLCRASDWMIGLLIAAGIFLPRGWGYLALLVLTGSCLVQLHRRPLPHAIQRNMLLSGLFVGWLCVSGFWSVAPVTEVGRHILHYSAVLFPALFIAYAPRNYLRVARACLPILALLLSLAFCLVYFDSGPKWLSLDSPYTGARGVIRTAVLALVACLELVVAIDTKYPLYRRSLSLCIFFIVTLTLFIATPSRSAVLFVFLGIALTMFYHSRHARLSVGLIALSFIVLLGPVYLFLSGGGVQKTGLSRLLQSTNRYVVESTIRFELYSNTIDMIYEAPVLGHGTGSWNVKYAALPPEKKLKSGYQTTAHQEYLQIWMQNGLVGLLLFCAWLYTLWKCASKQAERRIAGLLCVFLAVFLSLFHAAFRDAALAIPLVFLISIYLDETPD